jgi:hypothetical protein
MLISFRFAAESVQEGRHFPKFTVAARLSRAKRLVGSSDRHRRALLMTGNMLTSA